MRHFGLKVFSLAVAIVLSYVVNGERNSSVLSFAASIELRNLPDSKLLILPVRPEVQVTVRGPSFLVRPLAANSHSFIVRLPKEVPDRFNAVLQPVDLALPPAVEVLRIEPSQVDLRFDSVATKSVKVEVPRLGQLTSGFLLESLSVKPEEIEIRGPKREIDPIRSVQTYPVDLRSIEKSSAIPLAVRLPGMVLAAGGGEVVVAVKVAAAFEERRFEACSVEVRSSPGVKPREIIPAEVDVVVKGPERLIKAMSERQCVPYVRISTGTPEVIDAEVKLDLPEGIIVDKISPAQVALKTIKPNPATVRPAANSVKKR